MSRLSILTFVVLLLASVVDVLAQNEKPDCPTISVTGPAGVIQPGDVATFTGNVDNQQRFGPLQYKWTFTGGEVLKGQDTTEIKVRAKKTMPVQMYATVRVLGLPQGCLDTASEKVEFFGEPHPLLIDEFGRLANNALRTRLNKFFTELSNYPSSQGYIIVYGTEREMNTRERLVVEGITFRNYDRSRITIVRGGKNESGRVYTKLYRVPPGSLTDPVP